MAPMVSTPENPPPQTTNEVLGKCALDLFPYLRENGMEAGLRRALEGEMVQLPDVLLHMPKTGEDVWESCTYAPHRDADGNIVGVIAMVRDVTERHIAEETFRLIVVGTAASTGTDSFRRLCSTWPRLCVHAMHS